MCYYLLGIFVRRVRTRAYAHPEPHIKQTKSSTGFTDGMSYVIFPWS